MKKLYKYLYYRAYDLLSLTGNYDLAWGASHFLALFLTLLIGSIFLHCGIQKYIIEWKILGFGGIVLFLVFHLVNYFLFLKEENYKKVINNFSNEMYNSRIQGRIISIAAIIILVYFLF